MEWLIILYFYEKKDEQRRTPGKFRVSGQHRS